MHEAALGGASAPAGSRQWEGRRRSSVRQALTAFTSSVRWECRSEAESSRSGVSGCTSALVTSQLLNATGNRRTRTQNRHETPLNSNKLARNSPRICNHGIGIGDVLVRTKIRLVLLTFRKAHRSRVREALPSRHASRSRLCFTASREPRMCAPRPAPSFSYKRRVGYTLVVREGNQKGKSFLKPRTDALWRLLHLHVGLRSAPLTAHSKARSSALANFPSKVETALEEDG